MNRVRIGIVGMGAAGQAFVPAISRHPGFAWTAFVEPVEEVRQRTQRDHGVQGYVSLEDMLAHAELDTVYIATPTELHAQQAVQVAESGKHVLVEKPMATSLREAEEMTALVEKAGVMMVVGHSHSHDLPIKKMRQLIESQVLGKVFMAHNWCYTDWMNRPRRPEEFDLASGGGVTFRQGSHQFDILRALCGGRAVNVRAKTFDGDSRRRSVGAHTVFIEFDNGAAATAVYNGCGGFSTMDLCGDISEWGFKQPAGERPFERRIDPPRSPEDELRAKQQRSRSAIPAEAPYQPFFGLTLVSCELGDIRQSPKGLFIYDRSGVREIELPTDQSPRSLVLDEFHEAISGTIAPLHDGRWGMANLEICIAAIESSATGKSVELVEPGLVARTERRRQS